MALAGMDKLGPRLERYLDRSQPASSEPEPGRQAEGRKWRIECDVCDGDYWIRVEKVNIAYYRGWSEAIDQEIAALRSRIALEEAAGKTAYRLKDELGSLEREREAGPRPQAVMEPCPRCEVEIPRRSLLLRSGLPQDGRARTFDQWRDRPGTEDAYRATRAWAAGEGPDIFVLVGGFGTGKSHLLMAAVREVIDRMTPARYRLAPALLEELRQAMDHERTGGPSPQAILGSYVASGVLALDDFGAGREDVKGWAKEQMEMLIDTRYERGPRMIVSTNLTPEEMARAWGGRIADRLFDDRSGRMAQVYIAASSFRTGVTW